MDILIIGNGFDLAHKLPTSYMDFMRFLELVNHQETIFNGINDWLEERKLENKISEIYNNIKKDDLKSLCDLTFDNVWVDYFFERIKNKAIDNETWQGFENDIYEVVCKFVIIKNKFEENNKDEIRIKEELSKDELFKDNTEFKLFVEKYLYLNNVPNGVISPMYYFLNIKKYKEMYDNSLSKLEELIKALEIYLSYINEIDTSTIDVFTKKHYDKILNFNYTDTYRRLYLNIKKCKKCKKEYECIDYIHGKIDISNKTSCVVLGIDDDLSQEDKTNGDYFMGYKKYYQRIFKGTGCKYLDWLNKSNKNSYNFTFYGHSFSYNDRNILEDIFKFSNSHITIVYHDKDALNDSIYNIGKIIDNKELTYRTSIHKEGSIEFVSEEEFYSCK